MGFPIDGNGHQWHLPLMAIDGNGICRWLQQISIVIDGISSWYHRYQWDFPVISSISTGFPVDEMGFPISSMAFPVDIIDCMVLTMQWNLQLIAFHLSWYHLIDGITLWYRWYHLVISMVSPCDWDFPPVIIITWYHLIDGITLWWLSNARNISSISGLIVMFVPCNNTS